MPKGMISYFIMLKRVESAVLKKARGPKLTNSNAGYTSGNPATAVQIAVSADARHLSIAAAGQAPA
jgi:hypothetical protein